MIQSLSSGGAGGRTSPAEQRTGSSINSCTTRIESVCNGLISLINRVEQLANSTMGAQLTPVPEQKIDHPPSTLQEWVSDLEEKVTLLDTQVSRFF